MAAPPSNTLKGRKTPMRDWNFSSNADALVAILLAVTIVLVVLV
jgi:hypothetical protein